MFGDWTVIFIRWNKRGREKAEVWDSADVMLNTAIWNNNPSWSKSTWLQRDINGAVCLRFYQQYKNGGRGSFGHILSENSKSIFIVTSLSAANQTILQQLKSNSDKCVISFSRPTFPVSLSKSTYSRVGTCLWSPWRLAGKNCRERLVPVATKACRKRETYRIIFRII